MNNTGIKNSWQLKGRPDALLATAAGVLLVVLKVVYYYSLMGVGSGFVIAVLITLASIAVLFLLAKRKWIFGIVYLLLSVLMVIDVNYYSFFNRNLSISTLGAADLLGGVTESIKEIFMPSSLLLLVDALVILIFFIKKDKKLRTEGCEIWQKLIKKKTRIIVLGIGLIVFGCLILIVPKDNSVLSSVFSQEFFSYHMRDIIGINQVQAAEIDIDDVMVVDGNYEEEKDGKYFGCGEGMNLILIQVEAMQNFVINKTYNGQEITPFINKLLKEDTFYFDSYYQQTGSGNTSDAEFATNNSLYGTMETYTYKIYQDNYWRGLPVLLKEKGYSTQAFHGYEATYWNREAAYPGFGIDKFYSEEDFDVCEELGMGLSDRQLFKQSAKILESTKQPFYAFMITLSSHYPFDIDGYLKLSKEDKDTIFGDYLQSMSYYDRCLEELFGYLEESGLADNTIVAFYGDHLGMNPKTEEVQERMSEFLGYDYDYEDAMNVPLVIHVPGSGASETYSVVGGQTDFLPTIAYLMGFDTLDTVYFGHNLCTVSSNFVPIRSYMGLGSFVTGDIMFKMSKSGSLSDAEVVNIRTHDKIDAAQYEDYYRKSLQMQNTSDYYLKNDVLRQVYEDGKTLDQVVSESESDGYYASIETQKMVVDASSGEGETEGLYCLENFDRLYEKGVRAFEVNLVWTSDGHTMVMNSWDELDKYFRRADRINSYDTLQRAMKYDAIDGITAMSGADLLEWAGEHEDVLLYISMNDSDLLGERVFYDYEIEGVFFARNLRNNYPELLDRTIFVVKTMRGMRQLNNDKFYNILFYPNEKYTTKDIISVATKYQVYGVAMDIDSVQELVDEWTFDNYKIYGYTSELKDILRIESMGLSGVVIVGDSVL